MKIFKDKNSKVTYEMTQEDNNFMKEVITNVVKDMLNDISECYITSPTKEGSYSQSQIVQGFFRVFYSGFKEIENKIVDTISKTFERESFIDEIINRINRKQLK